MNATSLLNSNDEDCNSCSNSGYLLLKTVGANKIPLPCITFEINQSPNSNN